MMNPDVDAYIGRSRRWPEELAALHRSSWLQASTSRSSGASPATAPTEEHRDHPGDERLPRVDVLQGALLDDPEDVCEPKDRTPGRRSVSSSPRSTMSVDSPTRSGHKSTKPSPSRRPGSRSARRPSSSWSSELATASRRRPGPGDRVRITHPRPPAGVQPEHLRGEAGKDPRGPHRQVHAEDPRRQGPPRPLTTVDRRHSGALSATTTSVSIVRSDVMVSRNVNVWPRSSGSATSISIT